MPSTVTPRIYTGAFPSILVNSLRYVLYAADNPLAEVASKLYSAPHPVRGVSFPGLDRVNYIFRCFENTGAGNPSGTVPGSAADDIRTVINDFNFNPDNSEFLYRPYEELEVGITPGMVDGATGFTFDGTGGTPDWRGWEPILFPPGIGPLLKGPGYNYSYDITTGEFLFVDGSVLATGLRYLVTFEPQTISASPGVPGGRLFTEVLRITASTTLVAGDLGKKILIDPASDYIEITMPDIATAVENRVTFFETVQQTGDRFCARILKNATNVDTEFKYGVAPRTYMDMLPNERFEAYNRIDVSTIANWHTQNECGNFLTVGRSFASDATEENNAQLFDGSIGNVERDARIWDYVQSLDGAQKVSFTTWEADPTQRSKWSEADGSAPAQFHFPDRRDRHERNTAAAGIAGVPGADNVGSHDFFIFGGGSSNVNLDNTHVPASVAAGYGSGPDYQLKNAGVNSQTVGKITAGSGQNRVKDYTINRFVNL